MKTSRTLPPALFLRFFRWYCHPRMLDYIEGDLMEVYKRRVKASGKRKADLLFVLDVMLLFRPGIIRPLTSNRNINPYGMYRNYITIGLRNLAKNKLFSVINISGMAISIASFLLIALFVFDELQFDKQIDDYKLKYRVYTEGAAEDGSIRKRAMIAPMIAPTAAAEFPEVESYTRFLNFNYPILFTVGDKKLTESKGGYADHTIFDMLSMHLLEGNATTALKEPGMIAISHEVKKKYFGEKPAFGETIIVDENPYKVSAVFEDFSSHSHVQLNYLMPMEEMTRGAADRMKRWTWSQFHTYIKLKPGADPVVLEKKMGEMVVRNTPEENLRFMPKLLAVDKIHLYASDHLWDIAVRGNIQTFYILIATAIFILVIAILNFVNLSTARAINRVKEVGVRKVMGAFRTHLIHQFISESVIITLLALIIGCAIATLMLPSLNSFTEKSISAEFFLNPVATGGLIAFALFVGIAAGAYPAFYISAYNPSQILTGKSMRQSGKTFLRQGLVVFQFMLSFFLIIASTVVSDQHSFMRTSDMGFSKDNLIVMQIRGDMYQKIETTKQLFLDHPGIISASLGYGLPGEAFAGDAVVDKVTNKEVLTSLLTVDEDYPKTLGLEFVAGRDFRKGSRADQRHAFIITEQAAKLLGYTNPADALEHPLSWNRWDAADSMKEGKVIGVVKDIQLNSMRETISPVVIHVFPDAYSSLILKVDSKNIPDIVAHLEKTWKSFNTPWPFEYRFLDENFDRMYKSEEKLASLFTVFTSFTIFVACLGLFGLVVYSTSQRFKEIGIRKVLGASAGSIIVHISRNYLLLLTIAFVIAVPISLYAITAWLEKFAFHIPVTAMLFIKAALYVAPLSLLTVGLQCFKAARANPVTALKEQ